MSLISVTSASSCTTGTLPGPVGMDAFGSTLDGCHTRVFSTDFFPNCPLPRHRNGRTDCQPNKSGREGAPQLANVIGQLKRMQVISLPTAITNRSASLVRPCSADLGADLIGELGEP